MIITAKRQSGFTLVELMVAIAIGSFLMLGLTELFSNSRQNYRIQENLSRLQENGRFAMNFIAQDIRMGDFWGCIPNLEPLADIPAPLNQPVLSVLNASGIYDNYQIGINGVNDDADAGNNVIDGTDQLTIRGLDSTDISLTADMANPTATINVSNNTLIQQDSIVFISDCSAGNLFQVSNVPVNGANLQHAVVATQVPGNSVNALRQSYTAKESQIYLVNFTTYFIGVDPTSGQPTLYRTINGNAAQPLIEGVEDMQILYGETTDNDAIPNRYVTANNVGDMANVQSVKISLVLRTLEDNVASQANLPYTVFGVNNAINDRRIRHVFTSTIALRNRVN